jgi:2-keto-4-pentenoate hydratase
MERLLARREKLLAGGARPLGWKLAFGAPAMLETLGLNGPLVGFLTDATLVASGGEAAVGEWQVPKLEPEIGIHLGPGGEGVAAVAAAIELADSDRPATETEEVLAGDIFHRVVVLGEPVPRPERPIAVAVARDGERLAATDDAEATVGRLEELAAYVRDYLGRFGVEPREGEVVISGSTLGLIDVGAGESWRSEVTGVGAVEVRLG